MGKIVDPLGNNLVGRIYFFAYPKWCTCYEIAKILYPNRATQNYGGTISRIVQKYQEYFVIEKVKVSPMRIKCVFRSDTEPFLKRLVEKAKFTIGERMSLNRYLQGVFREIVGEYAKKFNSPSSISNLNAFEELTKLLTTLIYLSDFYLKYKEKDTLIINAIEIIFNAQEKEDEKKLAIVKNTIEAIGADLPKINEKIRAVRSELLSSLWFLNTDTII